MHLTTLIPISMIVLSVVVIILLCIEPKPNKHTPIDKAGENLKLTKKIK